MYQITEPETPFAQFLSQHEITQQRMANMCGVSRETVRRLCKEDREPSVRSARRIIITLQDMDYKVDFDTFWDL
ncbi:helix-turn-helix transcriptional regulator [Alkalicoccobacillus plakortidis]|uniref:Helix-turn-helix domain-containing protein n=1 Tax=Alkalicoccobacillus plakortidis TaxID=444060 RepID=A0ABT0XJ75_9BACI|nr:helix-turn-helix transcriptional regulator [Alkalicoccobacillus plakortidis]MCM2675775.1 helix-turn-helix domain-containing protein [Alkalicoccobacillus plakortidis]